MSLLTTIYHLKMEVQPTPEISWRQRTVSNTTAV